jgi:hypothetical protein
MGKLAKVERELAKVARKAMPRGAALPFGDHGGSYDEPCAACGEPRGTHIMPAGLKAAREAEERGEGLVVAVQGIALRGHSCWECEKAHGSRECIGHPWHHFVFHVSEPSNVPALQESEATRVVPAPKGGVK